MPANPVRAVHPTWIAEFVRRVNGRGGERLKSRRRGDNFTLFARADKPMAKVYERDQAIRSQPGPPGRDAAPRRSIYTFPMTDTQEAPPGYDVFFSYDRDDAAWAEKLAGALRDRGLRVWIDSGEIRAGEGWVEEIEEGLRTSRVYAMIVTRRALASRWVKDEYYLALAICNSDGVPRIVPVLVENVPLTGFLRIRQCVDFSKAGNFDAVVNQLVESITAETMNGERAPPGEPPGRQMPAAPAPGTAEIGYLDRSLARARRTVWEMWIIRAAAVLLGPLLYLLAGTSGLADAGPLLGVGLTLVLGLIGWGATISPLGSAASRYDRLRYLRDKLDDCRRNPDTSCAPLQAEVWRLVHGDSLGTA